MEPTQITEVEDIFTFFLREVRRKTPDKLSPPAGGIFSVMTQQREKNNNNQHT